MTHRMAVCRRSHCLLNAAPPDPSPSVDTSLPDEHEGRRSGRRVKAAQSVTPYTS